MEQFQIYCGGKFVSTKTILEVKNPFDGQVFAQTFLAGESEYEQAVIALQGAFAQMKELSSWSRSNILLQISNQIKESEETFARLIAQEAAKPIKLALVETRRAAQVFLVAAEEAKRLPMEYISLDWTPETKGREGLVKYFPIGPVAGIAPFNFPLNLAVHKIAPAIAAGCPIVLKPATSTPLSTLELAKIIDKTSLPKGAVSILPMDRQVGNMLVTDPRFKLLTFTGSPEVGWRMKEYAGKKKVVLELGGNAGTIVAQSANLRQAVDRCIIGGFAYQGQVCIHAQRIFVHESLFGDFAELLATGARNLKFGNPLLPDTQITAMIDLANALRVEQWIQEAAVAGAKIICGGRREGTYVEPTVIVDALPGMKVFDEEVFGPVVTVTSFHNFEDAVNMVNKSRFGLQAGVFTNNIAELDYAFNHLEVGGVIHNDSPIFRTDHMPYGGLKDSGLGREGVKYSVHDMLEARVLVK